MLSHVPGAPRHSWLLFPRMSGPRRRGDAGRGARSLQQGGEGRPCPSTVPLQHTEPREGSGEGGPHRDAPGSQAVGTRSGSTCVTGPGAGSTGRHQPRGPGGPGGGGAGTVSTGGSPSLDKRRWEMLRLRGRGRGAGPAAPPGPSAPPRPPWPGHRPLRVKSSSNCALLMLPLPHHGPRAAEPAQHPSRSAYPASTRSPRSDLSPSTSYSKGLGSKTGLAAGRSGQRLSLSCPWPEAARKTRAAPAPAVTPWLPMGLCASVSWPGQEMGSPCPLCPARRPRLPCPSRGLSSGSPVLRDAQETPRGTCWTHKALFSGGT